MNAIGWCSKTFNPVRGCLNEGECKSYCYARRMNKRTWRQIYEKEVAFDPATYQYWKFEGEIEGLKNDLIAFMPTWIESNFQKKFPRKSQRIFIGSMSEIYYWEPKWMERVLNKIKEYPQHTFQFLTKFPEVYLKYEFPKNCWLGVTITNSNDIETLTLNDTYDLECIENKMFLSIEPILEPINLSGFVVDWVIVGSLTGTKKRQPELKWISDIYRYCVAYQIPLFMKDSIQPYWGDIDLIKEFPNGK